MCQFPSQPAYLNISILFSKTIIAFHFFGSDLSVSDATYAIVWSQKHIHVCYCFIFLSSMKLPIDKKNFWMWIMNSFAGWKNMKAVKGKVDPVLNSLSIMPSGVWDNGSIDPHFLELPLVGGEWSASQPGLFIPGEMAASTRLIGVWVSPSARLDNVVKSKLLTLPGLEVRSIGRPDLSQPLYRIRYHGRMKAM
jgi:hypothetical protein